MSIGKITVELELRDGDFTIRAKNAEQIIRQLGGAATQSSTHLNSLDRSSTSLIPKMRDLAAVAYGVSGAFGLLRATVGELGLNIIKANSEMEKMKVLLTGLSTASTKQGQIAEATKDLNALYAVAQKAPFALTELANSMVKMKSVHLTDVEGKLKSLTNAIASFGGDNTSLHRATVAIQQMASKGVVSMEELRQQLGEAVPDAIDAMAFGLGKSTGQLIQEISKGTVAAVPAINAMLREFERRFSESGKNMMGTWSGLVSQLHTKWTIFLTKMNDSGFFDSAKNQLRDLGGVLDSKQAVAFGQSVGGSLNDLILGTRTALETMIKFGKEIKDTATALAIFYGVIKGSEIFSSIITGANSARLSVDRFRETMRTTSRVTQIPIANQMIQGMGNAGAAAPQIAALRAQQAAMLAGTNAMTAGMVRSSAAYIDTTRHISTLNAGMNVLNTTTTASIGLGARFLSAIGGWAGALNLVTMALALGVAAWQTWGREVESTIDDVIKSQDRLTEKEKKSIKTKFNNASEEDRKNDLSKYNELLRERERIETRLKYRVAAQGGNDSTVKKYIDELRSKNEQITAAQEAFHGREISDREAATQDTLEAERKKLEEIAQYDSSGYREKRERLVNAYQEELKVTKDMDAVNKKYASDGKALQAAEDAKIIEAVLAHREALVKKSNQLAKDILVATDAGKKSELESAFKGIELSIGEATNKLIKFKESLAETGQISTGIETATSKKAGSKVESIIESMQMQADILSEKNNDVLPMVKELIRITREKKNIDPGKMDDYDKGLAKAKAITSDKVQLEADAEYKKLQEKISHILGKENGDSITPGNFQQMKEEVEKFKTTIVNTEGVMRHLDVTVGSVNTGMKIIGGDKPSKALDVTPEFIKGHMSELVDAVVHVESRGRMGAVSSAGARGAAQIMPGTGTSPGYGIKSLQNNSMEEQKRFAGDYLKAMMKEFGVEGGIRAYNAGPKNWKDQTHIGPQNKAYYPAVMEQFAKLTNTQDKFKTSNVASNSSSKSSSLVSNMGALDKGLDEIGSRLGLQNAEKSHVQLTQELDKFHKQTLDSELRVSKDKQSVYSRETDFMIDEIKRRTDSKGAPVFNDKDKDILQNQINGEREMRKVIETNALLQVEKDKSEKESKKSRASLILDEREKALAMLDIEKQDYMDTLKEEFGYDEDYIAKKRDLDNEYEVWKQDIIDKNLPEKQRLQRLTELQNEKQDKAKALQDEASLSEASQSAMLSAEERFATQRAVIMKSTQGAWGNLRDSVEKDSKTIYQDVSVSMANGVANGFAEMAVSGKMHFADLARSVLASAAKMIVQLLVLKAVMTLVGMAMGSAGTGAGVAAGTGAPMSAIDPGLLGTGTSAMSPVVAAPGSVSSFLTQETGGVVAFEKGGTMSERTAKFLSQAPVASHSDMLGGGVSTKPKVALFGEGSVPEAFIPMQDRRSIPVTRDKNGKTYVQVPSGEKIPVTMQDMLRDNTKAFLNGGSMGSTVSSSVEAQGNTINVSIFPQINFSDVERSVPNASQSEAMQKIPNTSSSGNPNVAININVASDGTSSKSSTSGSGDESAIWAKMAERIKSVVQSELVTQRRPGGMMYQ